VSLSILHSTETSILQIPASIGDLNNLRVLSIARNQLTTIPWDSLGKLKKVEEIDLVGNPELDHPPQEVCNEGAKAVVSFIFEAESTRT